MAFGGNKAINWNLMLAVISNKPCSTVPNGNLINRTDVASWSIRARVVLKITWCSGHQPEEHPKHLGSFKKCRFPGPRLWDSVSRSGTGPRNVWMSSTFGIHWFNPLPSLSKMMKLRPSRIGPLPPHLRARGRARLTHVTDVSSSTTILESETKTWITQTA